MCISNVYVYVMCISDKWPISRIFYSMIWKHLFPNIWFYSQHCNQTWAGTDASPTKYLVGWATAAIFPSDLNFCVCYRPVCRNLYGGYNASVKANSSPFSADCFGWQEIWVWVPSKDGADQAGASSSAQDNSVNANCPPLITSHWN